VTLCSVVRAQSAILLVCALLLAGCTTPNDPLSKESSEAEPWLAGVEWDTSGRYSQTLEPGEFGILGPRSLDLEADDGTRIGIAYWRPDTNESVPIIVQAGAYYRVDMTAPGFDIEYFVERFVPHGFAYARIAVRGTGGSGGCQEFLGPNEQADLDKAITALATQPWSNGNVGMIGGSYDGTTPWMVAAQGNPHLKTIVPVAGISDVEHAVYPNGTTDTNMWTGILNYWRFWGIQSGEQVPSPAWVQPERWCESYPMAAPELIVATATGETGRIDPSYWEDREFPSRVLEHYEGSVFVVHGFSDTVVFPDQPFPLVNALADRGNPVKMMLGQWGHTFPDMGTEEEEFRWDFAELLLRWFQRWLYEDPDILTGPAVDVQDTSGAWRTEHTWPPSDAQRLVLHLGEGILAHEEQPPNQALVPPMRPTFTVFDERLDADSLFHLEIDEPMHLSGQPRLTIKVTPTNPYGSIAAILRDFAPDGSSQELAWALGSFPATARTAPAPGEPVTLDLQFQPIDTPLEAGHTLRLEISIFYLPPSTLDTIHYGEGVSTLSLPIIERDIEDGRYPGQP
jgi:predicted acyl esterase